MSAPGDAASEPGPGEIASAPAATPGGLAAPNAGPVGSAGGPDWRKGGGVDAPARRQHFLVALGLLLSMVLVFITLLFWVLPSRQAALLAIAIETDGKSQTTPFASAQLASLRDGGLFAAPTTNLPTNPTRDSIRLALAHLGERSRRESLVIYIAAPVTATGDGELELVGASTAGDTGRNRLTLNDVLTQLRGASSRRKLLVLDLTAAGDWSAAAQRALADVPDPHRLTLLSCAAGETSLASTDLARTVFGHYFQIGLAGIADGWNDSAARDGRITVSELAAYLRHRVGRWADQNRGARQTPLLVGELADFELRAAGGSAPAELTPEPATYPEVMRESWVRRDEWLTNGRADLAPTVLARIEAELLAVEQAWLAGTPLETIRTRLDRQWQERQKEYGAAVGPGLDPSPFLSSNAGAAPDPVFVEELRAYISKFDTSSAALAAPAAPADKAPAAPVEPEGWKTRPAELFARAAVQIIIDGPSISTVRLRALVAVLAAREPEPRTAEAAFLRRVGLAIEDGLASAFSADRLTRLLRAGLAFESLAARQSVFPWLDQSLTASHRDWIELQAFALAPGYVASADVEDRLLKFEVAIRQLTAAADAHQAANALRNAGHRRLAGATEESTVLTALRTAVRDLDLALVPPTVPLEGTLLATRADAWRNAAAAARLALASANQPFQPATLLDKRKRADSTDATPATLAELDELLALPWLPAPDRTELWSARLRLARRFAEESVRVDRLDDEAFAADRARPTWQNPRDQPTLPTATTPARATPPRADRTFVPDPPASTKASRFWAWQAERFEYESRNPAGLQIDAMAAFAARTAVRCRELAGAPTSPVVHPEWHLKKEVALTVVAPKTQADLDVRLLAGAADLTVPFRIATPSSEWVAAAVEPSLTLSSIRARPVPLIVAAGNRPASYPHFRGVLLVADIGGRPFARRLAVNTSAISDRFELLQKTAADAPTTPAVDFRLRPHGRPQPISLVLSNPSAKTLTGIVRLMPLDRETPSLTLAPGEVKTLLFPAKMPAPAPSASPAPGSPVAPPAPEFIELPESLTLEVLDPKTRDPLQTFVLPVRILDPADYASVDDVRFTPASGTRPSELLANVSVGSPFGSPDCPLELQIPPERNPGLLVRDASLKGVLVSNGPAVALYARRLVFADPGLRRVMVTVSADGVERVRTFTGDLARGGGAVRLAPVTEPSVRVKCAEFANDAVPLPVLFEVDSAPPGATLDVRVGSEADGAFTVDKTHPKLTAKLRSAGLQFDPTGGLVFRATIQDVRAKLDVEKLVGARVVLARLLDRQGKELAVASRTVVFDGGTPGDVRLVNLPPRIARGKPLAVRATCEPPVSGIAEVKFFLGKPVNGAPPPMAATVAGKPIDASRRTWEATLPISDDPFPADISVQFLSRSGLPGVATEVVERVDAAELAKPKPGSIAGVVAEGAIPQPGLAVLLFEEKDLKKAKAAAMTKDGGAFEFPDLPPGKYRVVCEKPTTNRAAAEAVEVAPGTQATVRLGLLLK